MNWIQRIGKAGDGGSACPKRTPPSHSMPAGRMILWAKEGHTKGETYPSQLINKSRVVKGGAAMVFSFLRSKTRWSDLRPRAPEFAARARC